jgi:hypothetical protein
MINENAIILKWLLQQPEILRSLEESLKDANIDTIQTASALDLGAWFHGFWIDESGYFRNEKGNGYTSFVSSWCTAALHLFRDHSGNFAVSSLLKEIGLNSITFHKSLLKDFGAAIKRTEWWKRNRTEITRITRRKKTVKHVMES